MKRHRGKFNPSNDQPYELSRSRIENFFKCPACFYMQQVEGIVFPSIPGFNINEATDILLKRDFDFYREKQESHPFLISKGYSHLIPFQHENFELWTQSLHFGAKDRMHIDHLDTNLRVGGGLDDVWLNQKTSKIHIVDYKSTSQKKDNGPINLDDHWKSTYKRQMDLYAWIMKKKGFDVDDVGFFLYCDGDRFTENNFLKKEKALMEFKMTLIEYKTNYDWIEETLKQIYQTLRLSFRPNHSENCEYGHFLKQSFNNTDY
tara:strand:+ start:1060 stop:1842 length:783 start_codon:yes stop_codon:yes gene_type:complete